MPFLSAALLFIQQASPASSPAAAEVSDPLKFWVQVGSLVGALIGLLTFLTKTVPWIKAKLDRRSLQIRIGSESYTKESLENSLKNFIPPLCQDVDPAGGDEPRHLYGVKQLLFSALDEALSHPEIDKYFILLADSGMGKTTALLNYYLRHTRRWRKPDYELILIPLYLGDADKRIASIPNQENTVLFLDALDEDTLAIVDYVERLRMLLDATRDFRSVLISCRTQFFSKDEEIPKETGRVRIVARRAGQEAEYYFQKIYLSPFSDKQVAKYLKRQYPFWRKERKAAFRVAKKIPHLTARPMLLAHIDDLLKSKREFRFSFELYEEMVEAWLKREKGTLVKDTDELREASEMLAVEMYVNRAKRKAEKIPREELMGLAKSWGITVADWKLSGRSLLNRDAEGNYKFAHRSVMEYLFVQRFLKDDGRTANTEWTDQMYIFLSEQIVKYALPVEGRDLLLPERISEFIFFPPYLKHLLESIHMGRSRGLLGNNEDTAKKAVIIISSFLHIFHPAGIVEWIDLRSVKTHPGIVDGKHISSAYSLEPIFKIHLKNYRMFLTAYNKSVAIHGSKAFKHSSPQSLIDGSQVISLDAVDNLGDLASDRLTHHNYYLLQRENRGVLLGLAIYGNTPTSHIKTALEIFAAMAG
jgi:hypothetical protein